MEKDYQLVFELQAEMLRVLANPKRLMIVKVLGKGEKTVGDIAAQLGIGLQNISQHLRIMKARGTVIARRDGQTIYYRLTTPIFAECSELVRQAIMEELDNRKKLLKRAA